MICHKYPVELGLTRSESRGGAVNKQARGQPSGQAGEKEGRHPGGKIETSKEESKST